MDTLVPFVDGLLALIPAVAPAALIAFIVDTLKRGGLKDGRAPLVAGLINVLWYGLLFYLGDKWQAQMNTTAQALVVFGPFLVDLFLSLLATAWAHKALAAIGIGYSHPNPVPAAAG